MKLINGDCLEVMDELIEEGVKVDAIITDPPYGTTACKWDTIIPFDKMWERLNKLIKPNGAIVLFGSEPFSSALRMSNIKMYKYDWIWEKSNGAGFVNAKNCPLKKHEIISIFSKGTIANGSSKRMIYIPQNLIKINKIKKVGKKDGSFLGARPNQDGKEYLCEFTNYPNTLLKFNNDKGFHPTQKPVALIEYLIKTYSLENEIILDFTSGSGTTGVAAQNTNRQFILIEKDKNYYDISLKRLQENKERLDKLSKKDIM